MTSGEVLDAVASAGGAGVLGPGLDAGAARRAAPARRSWPARPAGARSCCSTPTSRRAQATAGPARATSGEDVLAGLAVGAALDVRRVAARRRGRARSRRGCRRRAWSPCTSTASRRSSPGRASRRCWRGRPRRLRAAAGRRLPRRAVRDHRRRARGPRRHPRADRHRRRRRGRRDARGVGRGAARARTRTTRAFAASCCSPPSRSPTTSRRSPARTPRPVCGCTATARWTRCSSGSVPRATSRASPPCTPRGTGSTASSWSTRAALATMVLLGLRAVLQPAEVVRRLDGRRCPPGTAAGRQRAPDGRPRRRRRAAGPRVRGRPVSTRGPRCGPPCSTARSSSGSRRGPRSARTPAADGGWPGWTTRARGRSGSVRPRTWRSGAPRSSSSRRRRVGSRRGAPTRGPARPCCRRWRPTCPSHGCLRTLRAGHVDPRRRWLDGDTPGDTPGQPLIRWG